MLNVNIRSAQYAQRTSQENVMDTDNTDVAYRGYLIRYYFGRSGYYIDKGKRTIQNYAPSVAEAKKIIDSLLDE